MRLLGGQQDDFTCREWYRLTGDRNLCFSFDRLNERGEWGGMFSQRLPGVKRKNRDVPLLPL